MIEGGVTSGSREPLLLWGVLHLRRGEGGHLFEDGPVSTRIKVTKDSPSGMAMEGVLNMGALVNTVWYV